MSPAGSPAGVSAAQFIVDAANAAPGEVTVLALAAMTNVALALRLDPSVATKLKRVVVLGGAFFVMGNVNPASEANIWHDPQAADEAFTAFPDGVCCLVGLDVTQRSIMSGACLDALRDSGGRFAAYAWSICQFYKAYHMHSVGLDGIYLHDPTALVAVLQPQLFGWTDGAVRVATDGVARGKTLMDVGTKKCAHTHGDDALPSVHPCSDIPAQTRHSWAGNNDWVGRSKCRVALTLQAEAVLDVVTTLLSRR